MADRKGGRPRGRPGDRTRTPCAPMPETDRLGPQRRCSAGGSYDEELHGEARGLHRDPPRPGPEAVTAIRELGPTGAEATSADTADSALATWPGRAPALAPG